MSRPRSARTRQAAAPTQTTESAASPLQLQPRPFTEAEDLSRTSGPAQHQFGQIALQSPTPLQTSAAGSAPERAATPIESMPENHTGMPDALKSGLETLSGLDLSDVKVHRGSAKPAEVGAFAYAQGQDIYLGPGQEQHLPHEGWHVVQQRQGRVQPTTEINGASVNTDGALEAEASAMGTQALQAGASPPQTQPNQPTQPSPSLQRQPAGTPATPVVQRAAPLAFLGLTAEAWGMAANVVGTLSGIGAAAAGSYSAVSRGENGFGALVLPQSLMSNGDKGKLQQIVQFRIINAYVQRFLSRPENRHIRDELMGGSGAASTGAGFLTDPLPACHPPLLCPDLPTTPMSTDTSTTTGTGTDTSTSTTSTGTSTTSAHAGGESDRPTGAPTPTNIDEEVLLAVKNSVQTELETLLETASSSTNKEFMWGEDDTRGRGAVGSSGSEESVGVTGYLQFRNIEASVLRETLSLNAEAFAAVGDIPGNGREMIVHKFLGGSLGGRATWSAWDNLTVNVEGGAVQQGVQDNGSVKLTARTHWYWDRWGPNSETWMENDLHIEDSGSVEITAEYEGTP